MKSTTQLMQSATSTSLKSNIIRFFDKFMKYFENNWLKMQLILLCLKSNPQPLNMLSHKIGLSLHTAIIKIMFSFQGATL